MSKLSQTTPEIDAGYTLQGNTLVSKEREFLTEIGDEKQPDDFYPQVKVKRWDNECNFSMRLQDVGDHKKGKIKTNKKKVEWEGGGKKVEFYPLETTGNGDPGYEIMVVLDQPPASNVLTFSIQTKGLLFFYQPPLTDSPEDKRSFRPDNVVGSYAVYHGGRKRNNQYKTGKAFHIYRPHITDAASNETWGELNIDEQAGELTVTIPQTWLDAASYPVLVDPTIGYTTGGGSQDNIDDYMITTRFAAPEAGDANPGTFYSYVGHDSSAVDFMVGAYDNNVSNNPDGESRLCVAGPDQTEGTSPSFVSTAITWTGIAVDDYHLVVYGDGGVNYYYDTVTAGYEDSHYHFRTFDSTLPDPSPTMDGPVTREYSCYVDYTAAGGGGGSPMHQYQRRSMH